MVACTPVAAAQDMKLPYTDIVLGPMGRRLMPSVVAGCFVGPRSARGTQPLPSAPVAVVLARATSDDIAEPPGHFGPKNRKHQRCTG